MTTDVPITDEELTTRVAELKRAGIGFDDTWQSEYTDWKAIARYVETALRAERARAEKAERWENGWLIERGNTKPERLFYLSFDSFIDKSTEGTEFLIEGWGWTVDANKAARFGRKEDAEMFWRCILRRDPEEIDVVEHGFDTWPREKALGR